MNSVKKLDDANHRMVTAKGAEGIDNHRFPLAPFVWFLRAQGHGPNRCRYSFDSIKALTISAAK